MTNDIINIILAEDHELLRDGFAALIEKCPGIHLAAQASNGEQLIRLTKKWRPHVVLTDIQMPIMDGIEATRIISKMFPETGVIAYSMFNDMYLLNRMLEAGAIGYLVKNSSKKELIAAINSVYKGKPYFCTDTAVKLGKLNAVKASEIINENQLNEKDREMILFICRGMSNKEIAGHLYLSVRTIEGYREKVKEKTKTDKVALLMAYAIANNIIYIDQNQQVWPFSYRRGD
jgi:DNA-binding NarL/FixJ family response regulator